MKYVKVTDEWLYQYIPVVDEAMIRELEKEVDKNYQFSDKFEKKMVKLMHREKYQKLWERIGKIGKQAAAAALTVCFVLFGVTMSVEAYREKIFETVKTIWEDSFIYSYFSDNTQTSLKKIKITYIPEGYTLIGENQNENIYTAIFENKDGKQIICDQMLVSDQRDIVFDLEYSSIRRECVQEKDIVIYSYDGTYRSAYCEYGNYVIAVTSDNLSEEEILQFYNGIE